MDFLNKVLKLSQFLQLLSDLLVVAIVNDQIMSKVVVAVIVVGGDGDADGAVVEAHTIYSTKWLNSACMQLLGQRQKLL